MYRLSPVNQNLIKKDAKMYRLSPHHQNLIKKDEEGCQEEILVAPECITPLERLTSQISRGNPIQPQWIKGRSILVYIV